MKTTLLATALVVGAVTSLGVELCPPLLLPVPPSTCIQPNLTKAEFVSFRSDVRKFTRNYSSGLCAKFATALLDNLHERNGKAFPQLDLREGRLVQNREGRQTFPVTTSSNEILYAKNYKNVFEGKRDFVKITKKQVMQLTENTIVIAVYQPRYTGRPGHIEVIFKTNNSLRAASDKLAEPLFLHASAYKQVDFYYPVRENDKI